MQPLAIVEHLDVIEQSGLGLLACCKPGPVNALRFQGSEEALHGGIIVTIALPAHGGIDATGLQHVPVGFVTN